jgi:hypothetical protein
MNLNTTLIEYEKPVTDWLESVRKQLVAVTKLQKAVRDGNLRDLEKLHAAARNAATKGGEAAVECPAPEFDAAGYLSPEGGFVAELKEAAEKSGVSLFERDGVLFAYPVLVRPEPEIGAVRVDKKLVSTLRPSVLANLLKRLQASDPKARPERFIETLFSAYDLLRGDTMWTCR